MSRTRPAAGFTMGIETILVCEAQVPFVEGGAERLVRQLIEQLTARGYRAGLVSVPFKWYPKEEILGHAAAWRLLDLSESNGRPVDMVIGTKFPTYFARHPNKVTWLVHQYRAAYELCGTEYSDFEETELDVGLRDRLLALDHRMLLESKRLYTIAENTTKRLDRFLRIRAEALYHPPRLAPRLAPGPYGDYLLSVGRIESIKRVDLAVRAMKFVDPRLRLVVAGDGTHRARVEQVAVEEGVASRVQFLGTVTDEDLVQLYAGALAVIFPPYDEDYGYVTLEAFLCAKPVLTAVDSGGPREFVEDNVNGRVCETTPQAFADATNELVANRSKAATLGEAGLERARRITWDGVIQKLVGE